MENVFNTLYAIVGHPLVLIFGIMLGIVAFVWTVIKLDVTKTETLFSEQIWKLLPLIVIAFTVLTDYYEYLNVSPYLTYLGIESIGATLQTMMSLALVINIVAGHWVSQSMKDGKLDINEKRIIYIVITMLIMIQFAILLFGYLAHIRPHRNSTSEIADISFIRFLILVGLLIINTILSIFAIMLTYIKPKLLSIISSKSNPIPTPTPIPTPMPTPNPIPVPLPSTMSTGGTLNHTIYPF